MDYELTSRALVNWRGRRALLISGVLLSNSYNALAIEVSVSEGLALEGLVGAILFSAAFDIVAALQVLGCVRMETGNLSAIVRRCADLAGSVKWYTISKEASLYMVRTEFLPLEIHFRFFLALTIWLGLGNTH